MLRKFKKLWNILKFYFKDEDNLLLHLIEIKAYESLKNCEILEIGLTEEIEDLIFHIQSYYDIPKSIAITKYPNISHVDVSRLIRDIKKRKLDLEYVLEYADFLEDVEEQRAVEREIIFEHVKALPFGFKM